MTPVLRFTGTALTDCVEAVPTPGSPVVAKRVGSCLTGVTGWLSREPVYLQRLGAPGCSGCVRSGSVKIYYEVSSIVRKCPTTALVVPYLPHATGPNDIGRITDHDPDAIRDRRRCRDAGEGAYYNDDGEQHCLKISGYLFSPKVLFP